MSFHCFTRSFSNWPHPYKTNHNDLISTIKQNYSTILKTIEDTSINMIQQVGKIQQVECLKISFIYIHWVGFKNRLFSTLFKTRKYQLLLIKCSYKFTDCHQIKVIFRSSYRLESSSQHSGTCKSLEQLGALLKVSFIKFIPNIGQHFTVT